MPDIGLFDEPTIPAIYAAIDENRNATISIINVIAKLNNTLLKSFHGLTSIYAIRSASNLICVAYPNKRHNRFL